MCLCNLGQTHQSENSSVSSITQTDLRACVRLSQIGLMMNVRQMMETEIWNKQKNVQQASLWSRSSENKSFYSWRKWSLKYLKIYKNIFTAVQNCIFINIHRTSWICLIRKEKNVKIWWWWRLKRDKLSRWAHRLPAASGVQVSVSRFSSAGSGC